jgi:hypothetical protein
MTYMDPSDLQSWYEDMAERGESQRLHEEGECNPDNCAEHAAEAAIDAAIHDDPPGWNGAGSNVGGHDYEANRG